MSNIALNKDQFFLIRIYGPDARRYLQGRITQDVSKLQNGEITKSYLTTPVGQIEGIFNIAYINESFYLYSNPFEELGEFLTSLFRFKVADQVDYEILEYYSHLFFENTPDEYNNLNPNSADLIGEKLVVSLDNSTQVFSATKLETNSPLLGEEEYDERRIQNKVLSVKKDLRGAKVIPNQTWLEPYVSFTKGCYAGQEVIETADSKGKIKKTFHLLKIKSGSINPDNLSIKAEDKTIGKITSFSKSYAFALCTSCPPNTMVEGEGFIATVLK